MMFKRLLIFTSLMLVNVNVAIAQDFGPQSDIQMHHSIEHRVYFSIPLNFSGKIKNHSTARLGYSFNLTRNHSSSMFKRRHDVYRMPIAKMGFSFGSAGLLKLGSLPIALIDRRGFRLAAAEEDGGGLKTGLVIAGIVGLVAIVAVAGTGSDTNCTSFLDILDLSQCTTN